MRFKLFKMFESRSSELSESEFRKVLHEKCKDFVKSPKLLQRSKTTQGPIFSYINPKSYDRSPLKKSDVFVDGVESKHHTLLMDNLPSWSKFPKRSQSVIGLTSADRRIIFGSHRYLIIPFDGAKFGVAPSSDLWGCNIKDKEIKSPPEWKGVWEPSTSISFNDRFSSMMSENKISDTSYAEMINDIQKIYNVYLRSNELFEEFEFKKTPNRIEILFYTFKKSGFIDVEDGFNHFFSPDRFVGTDCDDIEGFHVMRWIENPYGGLSRSFSSIDSYEFWTDSECLLYYIGKSENEDQIKNSYESFISDFITDK